MSTPATTNQATPATTSPPPVVSVPTPTPVERIRSANDAADIYTLDELHVQLENVRKELGSFTSWGEVVFAYPPLPSTERLPPEPEYSDSHVINQGPYALDFSRSANKSVLEHESWFVAAIRQIDTILVKQRPRSQAKAEDLKRLMRAELLLLANLKTKEWQRRFEVSRRARRQWFYGAVEVVDTCACSIWYLYPAP